MYGREWFGLGYGFVSPALFVRFIFHISSVESEREKAPTCQLIVANEEFCKRKDKIFLYLFIPFSALLLGFYLE